MSSDRMTDELWTRRNLERSYRGLIEIVPPAIAWRDWEKPRKLPGKEMSRPIFKPNKNRKHCTRNNGERSVTQNRNVLIYFYLWHIQCYAIWRRVVLFKFNDVSEERTASIFGSKRKAMQKAAHFLLLASHIFDLDEREAAQSSETSVNFYKTVRCHFWGD
jgi:hypothetical protein